MSKGAFCHSRVACKFAKGEILVRVCVRVAYPNIKERRLFSLPDAPRTDIQSRVRGLVGAPRQRFPRNFLENWLHLNVSTYGSHEFQPRDLDFRCAAV